MSIVSSRPEEQLYKEEAAIAGHLDRQPTFLAAARDLFRTTLHRRFAFVSQAFDLDAMHVTDYRLAWNQNQTEQIARPASSRSLSEELNRYLASRELPVYQGMVGIFDKAGSDGDLGARIVGDDNTASQLTALLQEVVARAYIYYQRQIAAYYSGTPLNGLKSAMALASPHELAGVDPQRLVFGVLGASGHEWESRSIARLFATYRESGKLAEHPGDMHAEGKMTAWTYPGTNADLPYRSHSGLETPGALLKLLQDADNRYARDLPMNQSLKVWLAQGMARQRNAEANMRMRDGTLTAEGGAMLKQITRVSGDVVDTHSSGVYELILRVPGIEARVAGCLILTSSPGDLPVHSSAGVILLIPGQGLIEFSSGSEFNQYMTLWLDQPQNHPWLLAGVALNHREAVVAHSPRALADYPAVASEAAFTHCMSTLLAWQQDSCAHLIRSGAVEPLYLEQAIDLKARFRVGHVLQVREAALQGKHTAKPLRDAALIDGLLQTLPRIQSLVSPLDLDSLSLNGYRDDSHITDLSAGKINPEHLQLVSSRPFGDVLREMAADREAFSVSAQVDLLCICAGEKCIELAVPEFLQSMEAVVRPLRYIAVEYQLPTKSELVPDAPINTFKQQAEATLADLQAMSEMLKQADVPTSRRLRPAMHSALQCAISEVCRQFQLFKDEWRGEAVQVLYQRLPLAGTLPGRLRRHLETYLQNDRPTYLFDYGESVTLPEMLKYYRIMPPDPTTAADRLHALSDLEEQYAVRYLGMERGTPLIDSLLNAAQERKLLNAVKAFISARQPSQGVNALPPLEVLAHYFPGFDPARFAGTQPAVALQQLLSSEGGQWLGRELIKTLGWYGAGDGESSLVTLSTQLVWKALVLRYSQAGEVAGYDMHSERLWGRTYPWILSDFESYLLSSRQATSPAFAALLARLLQTAMPAEFSVRDIPAELTYGSASWVNLRHGAELAHAIEPGSTQRMTFQEVILLPGQQGPGLIFPAKATGQEQAGVREKSAAILALRLPPLLAWAALHGVVPKMALGAYSSVEIQQAVKALDAYEHAILKATNDLFKPAPERLEIAKKELVKHGLNPDISKFTAARGSVPLFELYAAGKHLQLDFPPHTSTTMPSAEEIRASAELFSRLKKLPVDIEHEFNRQYDAHEAALIAAQQTVVRFLLDSLPTQQRQDIECCPIRVLRVRAESMGSVREDSPKITDSLMLRQGYILEVCKAQTCDVYEIFPRALHIQESSRLKPLLVGGAIAPKKIGIHTWVHSFRHGTALNLDENAYRTGQKPVPNGISRSRLIVEELGSLLALDETSSLLPDTFNSSRSKQIARLIPLYVDKDQARAAARGVTAFDHEHPGLSFLKAITPFWGSIDDLLSDDQVRRASGKFGVLLDLLFFLPVVRFAGGAARVINTAGKIGFKAVLPRLGKLARTLVVSLIQELNPLDGLPQLLKWTSGKVFKGGAYLADKGLEHMRQTARLSSVARHEIKHGLATVTDTEIWKPMVQGDELRRVNDVQGVQVRNMGSATANDYRLLDPVSNLPYGPRLTSGARAVHFNRQQFFVSASPDLPDGYYLLRVKNPHNPSQLLSSGIIARPEADEAGLWKRRGIKGGGNEVFETASLQTWNLHGEGKLAVLEDMTVYRRSDVSLQGRQPDTTAGVHTFDNRSYIAAGDPPELYEVVRVRNRFWQLHADGEQAGPFVAYRPVQGQNTGVWELAPEITLQPKPRSKWETAPEILFTPEPDGPQLYRNLNNLPASTPWKVASGIDFKRIEQEIRIRFNVELEGVEVISTTASDLAVKMGIPYDATSAKSSPVAWTSPQGKIHIATDHPDYVVNGLVDADKVRSTVVHEYVHAASHRRAGLQAISGAEVNYDESVVDYFAEKIYAQIYPGRPYKSGYFTPDGALWHGQLVPFMGQSATMSEVDIQQALFHDPALFRPLGPDALQEWKRLTDF